MYKCLRVYLHLLCIYIYRLDNMLARVQQILKNKVKCWLLFAYNLA